MAYVSCNARLKEDRCDMNIFYLDKSFRQTAKDHCDKHVVKMILETAQLLSTAHRVLDGDEYADSMGLYKATHKNHPSAVWVRSNKEAYDWTYMLFVQLCEEYTLRYHKEHKTARLIPWLLAAPKSIEPVDWSSIKDFVPPPQCMPDEYKHEDTVTAYRNYYKGAKRSIATWRYSDKPIWWTELSYDY